MGRLKDAKGELSLNNSWYLIWDYLISTGFYDLLPLVMKLAKDLGYN